MKIIDELLKIVPDLTDEQKNAITKKFTDDVITTVEHEKKLGKAESERDTFKERAETAENTLKGFEGKDFETITRERDEWQKKAEAAEKDYTAKLAEREKADLLKEAFADVKFTSAAAKTAIMNSISESVMVKDGKLFGFNDLLAAAKESDADAFVSDQAATRSQFTGSLRGNGNNGNGTDVARLRAAMGLKTEKEN